MEWGLNGIQLSYDNKALLFDTDYDFINGIIDWIKQSAGVNPMYDFYVSKHDSSVSKQAVKRDYRGYVFSNEIIQVVNGYGNHDTNTSNNIDVLQLDGQPESAVEYCYNKNKRNNKGEVIWQNTDGTYDQSQLNWYLPAIDEIEDIVMSKYSGEFMTYSRFLEFQDKYYWSSQPSYVKNYAYYDVIITLDGEYYYDDINHARATSVWYDLTNQKFNYAKSGTTSYYNAIRVYTYWFDTQYELIETGTYRNHVLGTINREIGNKPRSSKARVRCVRRSEYTNTSATN